MREILIIFLTTINILSAQNKEFNGIVKDAGTRLPIAFVNIYFENKIDNNSTGSISNELGEFTLKNAESKVTFSHINYETITLTLNENFNEILLTPKEFILDELIISAISTREYLSKIIEDSNNKLTENTALKSYCREIVKVDDEFTKFSDALVDYYIKKGNGKSKIVLEQSRAFNNGNVGSNGDPDISEINSVFKLRDYVKSAYNFEMLNKIVTNENYEFERKLKKESNGKEYEFINIIPNPDSKQMLFEGFIIIDQGSKNILEYRVNTSKDHSDNGKLINMLTAKVKFKNILKWSKFKVIDNQYILLYNKRQFEIFVEIEKKVKADFDFNSDLFVYQFVRNVEIPKRGYNKETIYQAGTNYKEEFWEKYNAFPLTKDQLNFIKTANKK